MFSNSLGSVSTALKSNAKASSP